MADRIYLTLEDVLHIHDDQLQSYGGAPGVRDEGLILSVLLRPQTGYYQDLIAEAAALWESLTMDAGTFRLPVLDEWLRERKVPYRSPEPK